MSSALPNLPVRDPHGHKGTFGTVAVMGGCCAGAVRMIGAPALCALGALRSGCGLARVYAPAPLIGEVLTIAPSATGRALAVGADGAVEPGDARAAIDGALQDAHCVVVGPGMGVSPGTLAAAQAAVQSPSATVRVLDADALNVLAQADLGVLRDECAGPVVLTPHPGEYERLRAALGLPGLTDRVEQARALALRMRCVVVLKGSGTVTTDGERVYVNDSGSAALATAGTGDALAGVIAGLIAQHGPGGAAPCTLDVCALAAIGVHVHGRAADLWRHRRGATGGMLATDLLDFVPAAAQEARANA